MRFKYKKVILLTLMSTMWVGLLTISLSNSKLNTQGNNSNIIGQSVYKHNDNAVTTNEQTLVPTAIPTPTPLPVYNIEEDGYPKVTKLILKYYTAMDNCDMDTLQRLASDPSAVYTLKELKQITEYYESYRNIKIYIKKGYIEGTYIVYAYYEIKLLNIKTPAPSLSKLYVITDTNGDLKIFFGAIKDKQTKAYYDTRNTDKDVVKLISMTNERYRKAKESDKDLKNFCDELKQVIKRIDAANNADNVGTANTNDSTYSANSNHTEY